jgi:hypothetical protein
MADENGADENGADENGADENGADENGADENGAIRVIMEEARRLLVRQEADLDTLRGRVATILTGSSIVAAVFGAGISKGSLSTLRSDARITAFVLFGLTMLACLWILKPRTRWRFSYSTAPWLDRIKNNDEPLSEGDVLYNVARKLEDSRGTNAPRLECLQRWFVLACALLALQVIAWAVAIS